MKAIYLKHRRLLVGIALAFLLTAAVAGYATRGGGAGSDRTPLQPMAVAGAPETEAHHDPAATESARTSASPSQAGTTPAVSGSRPEASSVPAATATVSARPGTTLIVTQGANGAVVQSAAGIAVGTPIVGGAQPNGRVVRGQYQIGPYLRKTQQPGDSGNLVAACPSGTKVVGGGYAVSGEPDVRVYRSRMSGNGWSVAAANYAAATVAIEADAICLDVPGNVTAVPFNVDLQPGQQRSPSSSCPAGTVLLGGGYAFSLRISPFSSRAASENSWVVDSEYAADSGNSGAGDVTVEAYCYDGVGAQATTVPSTHIALVAAGQNSVVDTVSCPAGQVATGGGTSYLMSVPTGGSFSAKASVIVSRPDVGKWSARLQNGSSNSAAFDGASVQCVRF